MYKILFADDEAKIRNTVFDYFGAKGIEVFLAKNGCEAIDLSQKKYFDTIILDIMMPQKNGIEACKEIRKFSDVPVIFLSALGEEHNFLSGYGSGGDDYIVKPFPLSVLYEKTLSTIRRYRKADSDDRLTVSSISIDKQKMKAFCQGKEISLSGKDFQLLEYLMINKNIVLSRELILSRIWGYDFDGDNRVVDTHIKIIRKALGSQSSIIKTVVNVGYCFEEKREE